MQVHVSTSGQALTASANLTAFAGANFSHDVRFTQHQLQYFGCQDRERLSALQLEAMMVMLLALTQCLLLLNTACAGPA